MMDDLVKEVLESEDTAKRDEKLLDVLTFVSTRITTRIEQLEKHANDVDTDISEAFCRLNNEECMVKIHENTHLLPLAVVEPDAEELSNVAAGSSEDAKPTLPEFIFQAVQTGMDVINRRQICVDVQSEEDYSGETMRIYEDVNPYVVRPLPPLISSDEFYSPDFPRKRTITIDPSELTVDVSTVPQEDLSQVETRVLEPRPTPPSSLPTAVQPPPPPAPPPPPVIAVSPAAISPVLPAPVVVEQVQPQALEPTQPLEVPESVAASSRSSSLSPSISADHSPAPSVTQVPVAAPESSHKVHSRMPANLAEVIRNGPTPRKPQPAPSQEKDSLFDDSKSDTIEVDQPVENPLDATTPLSTEDPVSAAPPLSQPEPVAAKPQAAPRKKVPSAPKPVPRSRAPTVAQSQPAPQVQPPPQNPPQQAPVSTVGEVVNKVYNAPVRPKVVHQRNKVSIFSSSSDEDEQDSTSNHAPPTTAPTVVQNGTSREAPAPKPAALPANMVKMTFPTASKAEVLPKPPSAVTTQRKVSSRKLFDDSDDDDILVTSKTNTTSKPSSASTAPLPNQPRVPPTDLTNTQKRVVTKPVARKSMFSSSDSD